jgi:hypothetical protein
MDYELNLGKFKKIDNYELFYNSFHWKVILTFNVDF